MEAQPKHTTCTRHTSLHEGLGRQRFVAAASENSKFYREEFGPGRARSQEEDILSLCFQPHAGRAFTGLYLARASDNNLALVLSTADIITPLVSPVTDP